ncbi:MAG: hypothetical protein M1835_000877 [Candelina submexicana]|nr:MAG: hypothetical protein M1835_000877 [Candelina submexicana]
MIYAYLLVHTHMIRPDPANHMLRYFSFSEAELERERRYNKTVGKNLGLLRVSRQISDEALAVLYGRNTFRFSDELDSYETRERFHNTSANDITDNMEFWLLKIGSSNRKRLRSFQVKTTGPWFDAGGRSSRNYDREYDDVEDDIEDDETSDSESDSSITDADVTADTINAWNKGFTRSMDLLSAGHNLRSLSIIIADRLHPYSPIYVHVFRTWNSVTVKALSRVTGLKEFKVLGGDSPRSERPWDDDSRIDLILTDEQIEKEVIEDANIPYVQGAGGWKAHLGPDKSQWHHVIREEIESRKNGRRMDIVELRSNQLVRGLRAIMVA